MVERELQDFINILPLRNHMATLNLMNLVNDDEAAQVELNDNRIIQMVQEAEEEDIPEEEKVDLA